MQTSYVGQTEAVEDVEILKTIYVRTKTASNANGEMF